MSCLCFLHAWEMKSKIFQCPSPTTYAKPGWFVCEHQGGNTLKTVLLHVWSPCDEQAVHILGFTCSTNCSWLTSNMPLKGNKSLQHNFPFKNIISLLTKKKSQGGKSDCVPDVFMGSTEVWGGWSLLSQFVNVLLLLCLQGIVRKQAQFDDRCTVIVLLQGTGWWEQPSIHNDPLPVQVCISGG